MHYVNWCSQRQIVNQIEELTAALHSHKRFQAQFFYFFETLFMNFGCSHCSCHFERKITNIISYFCFDETKGASVPCQMMVHVEQGGSSWNVGDQENNFKDYRVLEISMRHNNGGFANLLLNFLNNLIHRINCGFKPNKVLKKIPGTPHPSWVYCCPSKGRPKQYFQKQNA